MINNILNRSSNLTASVAQPTNDLTHTLADEIKNIASEIDQEFLNQFSDEEIETLLKQELSLILTPTDQSNLFNYKLSPEE